MILTDGNAANQRQIHVEGLLRRITFKLFGKEVFVFSRQDIKGGGRLFIQTLYEAKCSRTGKMEEWKGRKWYLSTHMTDDEVIKTAYCAIKATVEHEVMEGFKVDGVVLFNPHVSFEELLAISHKEVKRV